VTDFFSIKWNTPFWIEQGVAWKEQVQKNVLDTLHPRDLNLYIKSTRRQGKAETYVPTWLAGSVITRQSSAANLKLGL
jgi:hypothetical protein